MASFDEVVLPGKAGKIKASIHTANYSGDITKSITVMHNDASQPPFALTMHARILGSVSVLPVASLALAPRVSGFKAPARLIVRQDPTEKGKMKIDGLKASSSWLKTDARVVKEAEPAADGLPDAHPGDVILSVQVVSQPPVGVHAETLTFNTGLTREPVVTIPVNVSVRGAITVQPPDLILQTVPGDPHRASGKVFVAVREDLDPSGLAIVSGDPSFTTHNDVAGQRTFQLTIDWKDGDPSTPTQSKVDFRLGDETVSLPVRVNAPRVLTLSPEKLTPH